MTSPSLMIVGAGPAGASAAIEAAALGFSVKLFDEQAKAGGQVWRAKCDAILAAPPTPEDRQGGELRARLAASAVDCFTGARVWQVERRDGGFRLGAATARDNSIHVAPALLLAGGARERVVPLPGWTMPGVIGLAAATALMKEHLRPPGRRVVVAGSGPLLFFVAHEILRLGGTVSAVVDLNRVSDWWRRLPAMSARPDLLVRGIGWAARLKTKGVPILFGHGVRQIHGTNSVEKVDIGPVDSNWAPSGEMTRDVSADAVCLGHGLTPVVEATRLLGAEHRLDENQGGWVPRLDPAGRTTVKGLYAAGDGAGIQGAAAAVLRGRLAALAAAWDFGLLSEELLQERSRPLQAKLKTAARFGMAMTSLSIMREGVLDQISADTLVCRCEGVTRGALEAEMISGGLMPNALKSGTRCGMGPCGGRYCTETATALACRLSGKTPTEMGLATARPPLRPVPVAALAGEFDYEALPIPAPAPL
ncbi:NAD(P)/FAD-dependent oxidoreductase [Pelagibius sp. CAU 1746]|uniref:NAD(P)/FAD-dependent oxidoreductase n=1 Tax=Pelagibius sp. CAU 1746 TaxID=3140370 RepID=UPI00325B295C